MIKAVIFDFDGVILETADIKTKAFRILFQQDYPDKVGAIVNYHLQNMGISRFIKFRYIYENILHSSLSEEKNKILGEKFSEIVFQEVLIAPFVPGAMEFFKNNYSKYLMFIASGTPNGELQEIVKRRGIDNFFKQVYGAPKEKPEIIRSIITNYQIAPQEAVFIGDAQTDMDAASQTGLHFIARKSGNLNRECKYGINDLNALDCILMVI